jgi:hypothetical protein
MVLTSAHGPSSLGCSGGSPKLEACGRAAVSYGEGLGGTFHAQDAIRRLRHLRHHLRRLALVLARSERELVGEVEPEVAAIADQPLQVYASNYFQFPTNGSCNSALPAPKNAQGRLDA